MATTRCISSHLMTKLLEWRNPEGSEENWGGKTKTDNCRVFSAEVGLLLLTATSAVETVAYATFALSSLALTPVTDRPYTFCARYFQSSSFTALWGLTDLATNSLSSGNIMTHESFARCLAKMVNCTSIEVFRPEDQVHIAEWFDKHQPGKEQSMPIPFFIHAEAAEIEGKINQGARFIKEELLPSGISSDIESFQSMDPSMQMFILMKAVSIYTIGSRSKAGIPSFLKKTTQEGIKDFRSQLAQNRDVSLVSELEQLVKDWESFKKGPSNEDVKPMFNILRNIASKELPNSLFILGCWKKATESN